MVLLSALGLGVPTSRRPAVRAHMLMRVIPAIVRWVSRMHAMTKSYDPPLTINPHAAQYRVDQAIRQAQLRLDAAIDAKRHHTSQNLANEVIKEARESLKKAERSRLVRIKALAQKTDAPDVER